MPQTPPHSCIPPSFINSAICDAILLVGQPDSLPCLCLRAVMQFLIVSSSEPGNMPTSFLISCSCLAVLLWLVGGMVVGMVGGMLGGGWLNIEGNEVGARCSTGL